MKKFRKEAVKNKERVKIGTMTERQFTGWLLEQEPVIEEIVGKKGK